VIELGTNFHDAVFPKFIRGKKEDREVITKTMPQVVRFVQFVPLLANLQRG